MEAGRVRAQLDRILANTLFAAAERPSKFLRFVVECRLEGREVEIKESVIAIEVLGRRPSFDSKSDPIVRVEAGRLRDRLRSYYQGEREADRLLITLPKGGYVPEFSERQLPAPSKRIDVLRLSILPPEHASFDSFAVSPRWSPARVQRCIERETDALGSIVGFARGRRWLHERCARGGPSCSGPIRGAGDDAPPSRPAISQQRSRRRGRRIRAREDPRWPHRTPEGEPVKHFVRTRATSAFEDRAPRRCQHALHGTRRSSLPSRSTTCHR